MSQQELRSFALVPDKQGKIAFSAHQQALAKEQEKVQALEKENFELKRRIRAMQAAYAPPDPKVVAKRKAAAAKAAEEAKRKASLPKPPSHRDKRWEAQYQQLKAFFDQNGHSDVPKGQDMPAGQQDLHTFCQAQRRQHKQLRNGEPTSMTAERIRKLIALKFVWILPNSREEQNVDFETRIEQLLAYRDRFGDLKVPASHPDSNEIPPGLGDFVSRMRKIYKAKQSGQGLKSYQMSDKLATERIAKLNEIGFVWSIRRRRTNAELAAAGFAKYQTGKAGDGSETNDHENRGARRNASSDEGKTDDSDGDEREKDANKNGQEGTAPKHKKQKIS